MPATQRQHNVDKAAVCKIVHIRWSTVLIIWMLLGTNARCAAQQVLLRTLSLLD